MSSTFYVGGLVNSAAPTAPVETYDSIDLFPHIDSEPQSLMGTRFACNTLENAMPLIMQEVHSKPKS